jgi:TetR/AcrR family transcriptional repressor of bet genes
MGRRSNTAQRRGQIVAALAQELAECGYDRASTKSIAARAGLAPGLLHYHFANKEEILLALVDVLVEAAELRLQQASADAHDARARLVAYLDARLGLAGGDPAQVRLWVVLIAEAGGQAAVRLRLARWLARDRRRLQQWLAAAGSAQPRAQAALLLATLLGSFSLHALALPGVPRGYALPGLLAWLEQVLPPAPTSTARANPDRARTPRRRIVGK